MKSKTALFVLGRSLPACVHSGWRNPRNGAIESIPSRVVEWRR
jgi:hypothetical protein